MFLISTFNAEFEGAQKRMRDVMESEVVPTSQGEIKPAVDLQEDIPVESNFLEESFCEAFELLLGITEPNDCIAVSSEV